MRITRRQLPLNALRAFEAAARHCHLARAAEELGVTQGAISQQVRALEKQLAMPLFHRVSNRLKLTPAGRSLMRSVSEGLDCITEGFLQLDPETIAGELSLCSTPSILYNLLIPVITRFSARYPEVSIRTHLIRPGVAELPQNMDVAVSYGKPLNPHLDIRKLYEIVIFPVASPSLFPDGRYPKKPRELLDLPLVHEASDQLGDWLRAYGIERTDSRGCNIYYNDAYQALMAARQGQGVVVRELYEVADDLSAGNLIRLLKPVKLSGGGYLTLQPESRQTLRARLFVEELEARLRDIDTHFQLDAVTTFRADS